jgi:hypothetical protein
MEAESSASTGDNSNFAFEAEDGAEVLQLDIDLRGHVGLGLSICGVGQIRSWSVIRD